MARQLAGYKLRQNTDEQWIRIWFMTFSFAMTNALVRWTSLTVVRPHRRGSRFSVRGVSAIWGISPRCLRSVAVRGGRGLFLRLVPTGGLRIRRARIVSGRRRTVVIVIAWVRGGVRVGWVPRASRAARRAIAFVKGGLGAVVRSSAAWTQVERILGRVSSKKRNVEYLNLLVST